MSDHQDDAFADRPHSTSSQPDLSQVDLHNPQVFGKLFVDSVYKIMKVASIYNVDHNQTRLATDQFMSTFTEAVSQCASEDVSILIQDELAIVNGETLRLRRRAQDRLNELRDLFAAGEIRGLVIEPSVQTNDLLSFLGELKRVSNTDDNLDGYQVDHIRIDHGMPTRSLREALANVNKSMYVAHVYIRGIVKTRNAHKTVREQHSADIPTGVIRRIMQSISELLGDEDFTILGLLPLRMVPSDVSTHSFNAAIYAMLLADRIGLSPTVVTYVGMAVIYQDLDRLAGISVAQVDQQSNLDGDRQFQANLRDVAKMLERVHGDVISTLRVLLTYERGITFDEALSRPFYRSDRRLHLISRIVDLARTYDLLIQGLQGYKRRRPDLAIEYLQRRAGQAFDPALVELLVSTLGIYPIGTTVELTSGEHAIVIRTAAPSSNPRRPVVRLLDDLESTVVDLSDRRFSDVDVAHSIDLDADQIKTASEVFLLT